MVNAWTYKADEPTRRLFKSKGTQRVYVSCQTNCSLSLNTSKRVQEYCESVAQQMEALKLAVKEVGGVVPKDSTADTYLEAILTARQAKKLVEHSCVRAVREEISALGKYRETNMVYDLYSYLNKHAPQYNA